jgi:restriction system protein
MSIPKYDEMMLPLLRILADGNEHHHNELAQRVADHFRLSQEERTALLPSGHEAYVRNRTRWAGFHLRKAGLATLAREATFRITDEGKRFLETDPKTLLAADLKRFPEYVAFIDKQKAREPVQGERGEETHVPAQETPEERMEGAFTELNDTLTTTLREHLAAIDPFRFEQVVLDLLVAMGYGGSRKEAAEVTQKTGDEGIDGVINEDRLGLDVIYIQAKRWKSNVGRPEIQSFVGALAGKKANKGIFITTSEFHDNATNYGEGVSHKVILIGGRRLAELMIEHGVGVSEEHAYSVKKIDSDYFEEA